MKIYNKSYKVRSFIDSVLAVLVMGGISVVCFIPTGIFLSVYLLLSPEGFWQKFVMFGLGIGIWFLGIFQGIGILIVTIFWCSILSEWLKLRSN